MGERSYCRMHSYSWPRRWMLSFTRRPSSPLPPPPQKKKKKKTASSVLTWWWMASLQIHSVLWHRVNCAGHVVNIALRQQFLESKWTCVVPWSNYACTHNPTHRFCFLQFSELSTIIRLTRVKCKEDAMCFLRGRKWIFKHRLLFWLQRVKTLRFRDQ
jgi:hypothetical protein